MLPATIATSVAPETIAKVSRLFNGSLGDILNELLQNARRAGAGSIRATVSGEAGARVLTIADDGHGIADPASIVALGHSGWAPEVREREDPAGMGVFSLAGRDVVIRSWSRTAGRGWSARILPADWETSAPIAVAADDITHGTEIAVVIPDPWKDELSRAIAAAARFFPLPVTLDGTMLERADFLGEAVSVETWQGCRIGVYRSRSCRHYGGDSRLNFHGVTIPCELPHIEEVRGPCWTARVDILDAPAIQLVLPARKEAVQNAALAALQAAVAAAIYRTVAAQGEHRLPFHDWARAGEFGVDLPEAAASLEPWLTPEPGTFTSAWATARVSGADLVIMPDEEPIVAEPAKAALRRFSPLPGLPGRTERAFEGYGWYDALPRVTGLGFVAQQDGLAHDLDGDEADGVALPEGYVDALTLVLTLEVAQVTTALTCEADIAFAGEPWSCDPVDEVGILVRRGSDVSVGDVVDLFEAAAFSPSDDRDADSPDTQAEHFRAAAAERIVRLLKGDDAALEHRVRAMVADHGWVVPEDRTVSVTLTRESVEIAIADRRGGVA